MIVAVGKFLCKKVIKKGFVGMGFVVAGPAGAVVGGLVGSGVSIVLGGLTGGPVGVAAAVACEVLL